MQLPQDDLNLFYKLHPSYLFYVNQQLEIIDKVESLEQFMELPFHSKSDVRNAARKHPDLLQQMIRENPFAFNDVELAILNSWQYALDSSFYLMRYEKDHAVFLDTNTTPRAYAVTSLKNDFPEVLGDKLPLYVKTVLLPFKNQIIYDGFIFTYPVIFDPPIVQELETDLEAWSNRHGLVAQLPFIGGNTAKNDEELLRYYLRSHRNKEVYASETQELIRSNPDLKKVYFELSGRLDAREARRYFRDIGMRDVWCAVLQGRILTTGKSREAVIETLNAIMPRDRKLFPFIFHFKG